MVSRSNFMGIRTMRNRLECILEDVTGGKICLIEKSLGICSAFPIFCLTIVIATKIGPY